MKIGQPRDRSSLPRAIRLLLRIPEFLSPNLGANRKKRERIEISAGKGTGTDRHEEGLIVGSERSARSAFKASPVTTSASFGLVLSRSSLSDISCCRAASRATGLPFLHWVWT